MFDWLIPIGVKGFYSMSPWFFEFCRWFGWYYDQRLYISLGTEG